MLYSGTQVEFFRQHERQMNECQPEGLTQQLLARFGCRRPWSGVANFHANIFSLCRQFHFRWRSSPFSELCSTPSSWNSCQFVTLSYCRRRPRRKTFLTHFIIFLILLYVSHSHAGIMRTCRGVWVTGYLQSSFWKCEGNEIFILKVIFLENFWKIAQTKKLLENILGLGLRGSQTWRNLCKLLQKLQVCEKL